jgi:N-acetylglucosamine kinase-like BadF-type ATPase
LIHSSLVIEWLCRDDIKKKCAAEVASSVASAEKEGDEKGDVVLAEDVFRLDVSANVWEC